MAGIQGASEITEDQAAMTNGRGVRLLPTLTVLLMSGVGCASQGRLALRSAEAGGERIRGAFTQAVYGYTDRNTLHVLLVAGEISRPEQAVHLRMHWVPSAGSTPVDARATNASLRHVVFDQGGVAVYTGAGFLFPENDPSTGTLRGHLRQATMRLLDATDGFDTPISLAVASGRFTASRDDGRVLRLMRWLERTVHQRLGYPVLVDGDATAAVAAVSDSAAADR